MNILAKILKRKKKVMDEIEKLLEQMEAEDPLSDDYAKMLKVLTVLYRNQEISDKKSVEIIKSVLGVVGSVGGILLILNFERFNIVRSKALSFIIKGRV